MSELRKIKRALISVSDKTGIADLARALSDLGVEIISTGGTASEIRDAGIAVAEVSDVTGFPEMMDGRVKTLHPKIHGAFLALRDNAAHVASMQEHGIEPIDLVVVNLYPFEQTVAKEGVTEEDAVENIDIGGPAMIRSASKNWRDVAVVTDPALYPSIVDELIAYDGALSAETRKRLATIAYARTAAYDLAISSYLTSTLPDDEAAAMEPFDPLGKTLIIDTAGLDLEDTAMFEDGDGTSEEGTLPDSVMIEMAKVRDLRYGENPHQAAGLFDIGESGGVANAELLHGKEMSYNNYVDADAAWRLVSDLGDRAVAIIKHTNPAGVGTGGTNLEAYRRALATDPVSAFGGIVALNTRLDEEAARAIAEIFTEVVIAPDFEPAAFDVLAAKKNLRVLKTTAADQADDLRFKQISGGFLVQTPDVGEITTGELQIVTSRQPSPAEMSAMLFAWKVCKHVRSNAIVLADAERTLGVGAGQMNRVDSIRIAAMRAQRFELPLEGAALASDAFFPFRDNVDEAAAIGISAIIQPGGSVKDAESIAAADEHGITMAFTGIRHFNH